jgi:transcriptional regulator with XRE-family HTH domain
MLRQALAHAFGVQVCAARQAQGLTLSQLAKRAGIGHPSVLRKIEEGAHCVQLDTAFKLATALRKVLIVRPNLEGVGSFLFADPLPTTVSAMLARFRVQRDAAQQDRAHAEHHRAEAERQRLWADQAFLLLATALEPPLPPPRGPSSLTCGEDDSTGLEQRDRATPFL